MTELPRARKRPKQSRSAELVRAIREACLKILDEEGAERLTTQRIADVAGVNIASVYQYFPNKEAVLAEVYEDQLAELADQASAEFKRIWKLSSESFEDTLRAIIAMEADFLQRLYQMNPDFYQQYHQALDVRERVNQRTQAESNPSWADWFSQFLAQHADRLQVGDRDVQAFLARHTLEGALTAALRERPQALGDESFRAEVLALLLRYLLRKA
ncbi:AcrR family transcriptional regulator [Litorivivens lipolytica]|uniref:AcrR family transcriptional regulator n=1 Tax=Litorivivens lipolytica TaxID=1524264 RepID=A0A7W4Z5A5_9GAMM|nr:TetR/AcrR family transcriptional regulator [Litorivivens lipolytica]MBB3046937.1 AcrR family transcriptional regulator [Litorivivens lipolytica]